MGKRKSLVAATAASLSLLLASSVGIVAAAAEAEPASPAPDGTKYVDALPADEVLNWINVTQSSVDEEGVHGIRNYNPNNKYENGIGLKQQFNVDDGNSFSIEFSVPNYDHETRQLIAGHRDVTKPYDIYLVDIASGFYVRYRLWMGDTTNPEKNSVYIEFCEEKQGWNTHGSGYISGVATNGSSFKLSYDATDYMSFEWQGEMTSYYDLVGDSTAKETYKAFMDANFKNVSTLEVWFAFNELEPDTYHEVVIKSLNGQSMCTDGEGKLYDDKAPVVPAVRKETQEDLKTNYEYNLKLEKYLNDPGTKADFVVHPIYDGANYIDDLIAGAKVQIKHSSESEFKEVGVLDASACMIKQVRFEKSGTYEMRVAVTDIAGNVGISPTISVTVSKGYDIVLQGDIPATGAKGQAITLPAAVASDENGVTREYTVAVEDPIGNAVEVTNNQFTPQSVGIYYVTYSSEYTDGSGKHEAKKVERQIIVTNTGSGGTTTPGSGTGSGSSDSGNTPSKKGCKSSLSGVAVALGMAVLAVPAAVVLRKKKKGN